MPNWKEYKVLIGLCIFLITSTAAAIWHFAPMTLAQANQEQIAMMSESQQLKWMQSEFYEERRDCVEKKTDEWQCSEDRRMEYRNMLLDINILRLKLGLESLDIKGE